MKNSSLIMRFIGLMLISAVGLLILAASTPSDLPPRPVPPTPTSTPAPTTPPTSNGSQGGLIILNVASSVEIPAGTWTVVQWEDPDGEWHNVEGWQGNINENLQVVWWVAPDDLGSSPFRWAVWDSEAGNEVLVVSDEFTLPHINGQIIYVDVTLP